MHIYGDLMTYSENHGMDYSKCVHKQLVITWPMTGETSSVYTGHTILTLGKLVYLKNVT